MRVIGHTDLEDRLRDLVKAGHVNRTFLFLGQKDAGKTFFGKFFSSLILDSRVFRGTHPDFFYFKGSQGKYSSLLDEFLEACDKKPFEGKNVVVFFDDIDLIPLVSLNTLLKTLEEPAKCTTIILSAHSQESLLDTIISRSFKFNLTSRTKQEKEEILYDMGIKDGSYRLAVIDDIKICCSSLFKEFEEKASLCYKFYDSFISLEEQPLFTEIQSCLEKVDLRFFFETIRNRKSSLSFQKEIISCLRKCSQYNNKFLILFNFVMFLKSDGRKTA